MICMNRCWMIGNDRCQYERQISHRSCSLYVSFIGKSKWSLSNDRHGYLSNDWQGYLWSAWMDVKWSARISVYMRGKCHTVPIAHPLLCAVYLLFDTKFRNINYFCIWWNFGEIRMRLSRNFVKLKKKKNKGY
jgi:hypothetical protein